MTTALFVLLIHSWKERSIKVAPLEGPEIVRCRMAVRFSTVDEHTVSLAQLISLSLIGKFPFTRQNDEAKK